MVRIPMISSQDISQNLLGCFSGFSLESKRRRAPGKPGGKMWNAISVETGQINYEE